MVLATCMSAAKKLDFLVTNGLLSLDIVIGKTTDPNALGVKVTGTLDTTTRSALARYQKAHDLPPTATLDQPTWSSLVPASTTWDAAGSMTSSEAARYGAKNYPTTLGPWATGKSVLVLQVALAVPRADRNGYLGPRTVAAVKARQQALGRPVTGRWSKADWAALAAAS